MIMSWRLLFCYLKYIKSTCTVQDFKKFHTYHYLYCTSEVVSQYHGLRGKFSSSSWLSIAVPTRNSCGFLSFELHLTDRSVNTEYGANRNSPSPPIKEWDTKDMCCTRYSGLVSPLLSNTKHHIAQVCFLLALCTKSAATDLDDDVARNPGTRYFLPSILTKNGWYSSRKLPPRHVSPLGG